MKIKMLKKDAMIASWKPEMGAMIGPKYLHEVKAPTSSEMYGYEWTESGTMFFSLFSSRPVER